MANPNLRAIFDEVLKDAAGTWTPAEIEMGHRTVGDLAQLEARALMGEDVATELAHVKATALSLAAGQALTGARAITTAIFRFTLALLHQVVPVPPTGKALP